MARVFLSGGMKAFCFWFLVRAVTKRLRVSQSFMFQARTIWKPDPRVLLKHISAHTNALEYDLTMDVSGRIQINGIVLWKCCLFIVVQVTFQVVRCNGHTNQALHLHLMDFRRAEDFYCVNRSFWRMSSWLVLFMSMVSVWRGWCACVTRFVDIVYRTSCSWNLSNMMIVVCDCCSFEESPCFEIRSGRVHNKEIFTQRRHTFQASNLHTEMTIAFRSIQCECLR